MKQQSYYRPEWTCGRYNNNANVALMYNLIEGKSFFFKSHSAKVIGEVLSYKRNQEIDIESISANTDIPIDSIIEFFDDALINAGLIVTHVFSKNEIHELRHKWSEISIEESIHYNLSNLKTEQIIESQTAEMEYNKYLN